MTLIQNGEKCVSNPGGRNITLTLYYFGKILGNLWKSFSREDNKHKSTLLSEKLFVKGPFNDYNMQSAILMVTVIMIMIFGISFKMGCKRIFLFSPHFFMTIYISETQ